MAEAAAPLACFDAGPPDGYPLVLLHGFPLHHRMWRGQFRVHPRVRVIAPDLRGFGASPLGDAPLPTGPEGIARMAGDVLALADRLDLDRFMLGGWSMGCEVAMALALAAPERISGLVFAGGQPQADSEAQREKHARNAARVEEDGVEAIVPQMLDAFFLPRTRAERPDLLAEARVWMHEASPEGVVHACYALRNQADHRARLSEMRVPALVIVGRHDAMTPPAWSEAAAEGMPHARLRVIDESAHLTPLEAAPAFNDALRAWLDDALPRVAPARASPASRALR